MIAPTRPEILSASDSPSIAGWIVLIISISLSALMEFWYFVRKSFSVVWPNISASHTVLVVLSFSSSLIKDEMISLSIKFQKMNAAHGHENDTKDHDTRRDISGTRAAR